MRSPLGEQLIKMCKDEINATRSQEKGSGAAPRSAYYVWRKLGDGKPARVKKCTMCGVAPITVEECGMPHSDCPCGHFEPNDPCPATEQSEVGSD